MTQTQRTFTDIETGCNYRLYTSQDASKYHLLSEGQPEIIADNCEVNGFYLAAHTGITIRIVNTKEKCKKELDLFEYEFENKQIKIY